MAKKAPAKAISTKQQDEPAGEAWTMLPAPGGVTVRMYRQGLGDCFLVCFRKVDGTPFYLLIDCGVIAGAPQGEKVNIVNVAKDIAAETKGHIDILAITHEHWDHVSGFHPTQAQDVFAKVEVDATWFAWTEDPKNKVGNQLREHRAKARKALKKAVVKLNDAEGVNTDSAARIESILGFFGDEPGLGASGDKLKAAMDFVRNKAGSTEYLHPGQLRTLDGVEGVRFYVLGPPEDEVIIRKLDASSGLYSMGLAAAKALETTFFAAMGVGSGDTPEPSDKTADAGTDKADAATTADEGLEEARVLTQPFDDCYKVGAADARGLPFFNDHYGFGDGDEDGEPHSPWRRIDTDWMEAAGEFALQLDSYTNNTSLAFAIELGYPGKGKVLLFPGDAQLGNWLSWFGKVDGHGKDMAWPVTGVAEPVTAESLIRRTVLYKVGHHGSHNATLREQGLQLMGGANGHAGFVAMLPVDEHVAHVNKHWNQMPLQSLVTDLVDRTKGRVMRVDEDATPDDTNPTLKITGPKAPADTSWRKKNPLYFEYRVEV